MLRVLYVDDDKGLLEMGKIFLEEMGLFSIDTIDSATAALALIREREYDAIISDYQMPVMDGIGFLKAVRTGKNPVPFILFTGKGREEVVIQALNEGADYYLQKGGEPVSQFTELSHKIRQAVQQRRAEAIIRDHERREADIINFLPDATFAIDAAGTVIAWNRAMEDFTGIVAQEILGKGDYEYALPLYNERRPLLIDLVLRDDPEAEARYPYVIRSGRKLYSETLLPARGGNEPRLIWFTASPIYDTKGKVVGAIESIRDITDRKRAEEKLIESERRYREVVETQTEFVSRFLPDGTHVFVNEAYCRHFGKDRGEIIGHRFVPEIPPEDRAAVKAHFAALTREHPVAAIEHRVVMPDGSIRWHYWNDHALFDANGRLTEYQSVGKDITERREAEEKLRFSEQKFAAAFEASPFPVAITELETGMFASINQAFETWSGYSREDVKNTTSLRLDLWVNPDERREIANALPAGGTVRKKEVTLRLRSGEERTVLFSARAFRTGEVTYMFSLAEDVTESRRTAAALREREDQFSAIFNTAQMGFVVIDRKTHTILQANARAREMIGAPEEEITGRGCHTFICPAEQGRCPVTDCGQTINASERVLLTKDGRKVPILKTVVPALIGNRNVLFESFLDISDRKLAKAALMESETLFKTLVESIRDPMVILSFEGTILFANPAALAMMGYSSLPAPGAVSIARYLDRQSYSPALRDLQALKATGQPMTGEYYLIHPDGSRRCVEACGVRIQYRGTEADLVSLRDVTDRNRVTADLMEAEQRLTDIINFLPDATFAIDTAGTVIAWNRAIEEMTGVAAAEILGKGGYAYAIPFYGVRRPILIDLISRDDDEIRKNYSFVRRDGDVLTAETTMARPGGMDRFLWGKAAPLFNAKGERTGAIESIRDITEWRMLEDSIRKLRKE